MVTTKASSCDWSVPSLFSFEKPKVGMATILAFLQACLLSSKLGHETTDITPKQVPVLPLGLAKMSLIVPNAGRGAPSLWYPAPECPN